MGILQFIDNPLSFVYFAISILAAITIHEFSHAWVAKYLGDPTAERAGRVSLNPLAHLDPFGTIMLLLVGFGWGKPVPTNPNNFKNPRLGSALTAVAGPISNLTLAFLLAMIYRLIPHINPYVGLLFITLIFYNLVIMIFNLLPVPPLDGSHILAIWFPEVERPQFMIYGLIIVVAFVFLGGSTLLTGTIRTIMSAWGIPLF